MAKTPKPVTAKHIMDGIQTKFAHNKHQFGSRISFDLNQLAVDAPLQQFITIICKAHYYGDSITVDTIEECRTEIIKYMKTVFNADVISANSPIITVDHSTYWDESTIEVYLTVRLEVISWDEFAKYNNLLAAELVAKREADALRVKTERAAKRAAKKNKEQEELALLATLKAKYPNA